MHTFASLHRRWSISWLAAATIALAGCSESASPSPAGTDDPALGLAPAPAGLATVDGTGIQLWPFLSTDLETEHDPLSILVTGEGDPRRIRAALLSLNGDRSALPPPFDALALFDCTWTDGIGDEHATYIAGPGWSASAIQLECGTFGPAPRFHVRLFDAGSAVLIGAHFEIQVPGTTDHEVLNFDIAKALVAADLLRAGVAGAPASRACRRPRRHLTSRRRRPAAACRRAPPSDRLRGSRPAHRSALAPRSSLRRGQGRRGARRRFRLAERAARTRQRSPVRRKVRAALQ